MAEEEKTKWVICASCGYHQRSHRILYEKSVLIGDEDGPTDELYYRVVQCMGCNSIKYTTSRASYVDTNHAPWEDVEIDTKVYPDAINAKTQRVPLINQDAIDDE